MALLAYDPKRGTKRRPYSVPLHRTHLHSSLNSSSCAVLIVDFNPYLFWDLHDPFWYSVGRTLRSEAHRPTYFDLSHCTRAIQVIFRFGRLRLRGLQVRGFSSAIFNVRDTLKYAEPMLQLSNL
jgi:hypothetical protein